MKRMPTALKILLPWIGVYLLVAGGTAAFAASMYGKYSERHLPAGNISLTVGKTRYELGEPITFTVTNHFPATIYVANHCPEEPLNVYRFENGSWVQLHDIARSADSECYTEPRSVAIPPEGSRSYDFGDWPRLFDRPGVYRIATAIDHYDSVPFQDFVVLEPAPAGNASQAAPAPSAAEAKEVLAPVALPVISTANDDVLGSLAEDDRVPQTEREWEREHEEGDDD